MDKGLLMTKCKMARKELEQFQDVLFHYNPYEDLLYAFKRSDANDYFSNRESVKLLKGTSIKVLISAITDGIPME